MMSNKVRHVLGISGGKDSAALAIYLRDKYPELDMEYYFCDTGKELEETYQVIAQLENYLGKGIARLKAAADSIHDPFDHYYSIFGSYLPSSSIRWCTKYLKLYPFEEFVGDDRVISYVGIRGDEEREGYISRKSNIQSIFPFRENIWSNDVISDVLDNRNIPKLVDLYRGILKKRNAENLNRSLLQPLSDRYNQNQKLKALLSQGIRDFNTVVFSFLKDSQYPISLLDNYPLVNNEDILVKEDIINLLLDSGVGIPKYYDKIEFEVDGAKGEYSRSRSGCYFCFFQQKIEWVWLYEQHPLLFEQAMQYENEKEGFTWNQNESLHQLMQSERLLTIKRDFLNKSTSKPKSPFLLDILDDAETSGCAACFI